MSNDMASSLDVSFATPTATPILQSTQWLDARSFSSPLPRMDLEVLLRDLFDDSSGLHAAPPSAVAAATSGAATTLDYSASVLSPFRTTANFSIDWSNELGQRHLFARALDANAAPAQSGSTDASRIWSSFYGESSVVLERAEAAVGLAEQLAQLQDRHAATQKAAREEIWELRQQLLAAHRQLGDVKAQLLEREANAAGAARNDMRRHSLRTTLVAVTQRHCLELNASMRVACFAAWRRTKLESKSVLTSQATSFPCASCAASRRNQTGGSAAASLRMPLPRCIGTAGLWAPMPRALFALWTLCAERRRWLRERQSEWRLSLRIAAFQGWRWLLALTRQANWKSERRRCACIRLASASGRVSIHQGLLFARWACQASLGQMKRRQLIQREAVLMSPWPCSVRDLLLGVLIPWRLRAALGACHSRCVNAIVCRSDSVFALRRTLVVQAALLAWRRSMPRWSRAPDTVRLLERTRVHAVVECVFISWRWAFWANVRSERSRVPAPTVAASAAESSSEAAHQLLERLALDEAALALIMPWCSSHTGSINASLGDSVGRHAALRTHLTKVRRTAEAVCRFNQNVFLKSVLEIWFQMLPRRQAAGPRRSSALSSVPHFGSSDDWNEIDALVHRGPRRTFALSSVPVPRFGSSGGRDDLDAFGRSRPRCGLRCQWLQGAESVPSALAGCL